MATNPSPETQSEPPPPLVEQLVTSDRWLTELGELLHELECPVPPGSESQTVPPFTDNQLAQVRLGTASSLFVALRCKNPATAAHALRVALTTSAWAMHMGMEPARRDVLEVAALLHDVGVIGVPDQILSKPGPLTADETAIMAQSRRMSLDVLRQSCSCPEILSVVEYVGARYDGSREGYRLAGDAIPLGARMLTIVEAFDAMTTERVYRPAIAQERAIVELFDCAGGQFDPDLVKKFAQFHAGDQSALRREVAGRWLKSLDGDLADSFWQLNRAAPAPTEPQVEAIFQSKFLDSIYDAVVFIDATERVTLWNHGAERLTGIAASSVCQRPWSPSLLRLCDEKGQEIGPTDGPVVSAIRSGVQSLRRLTVSGRNGRPVTVDTHAIPVIAEDGSTLGAIALFHDASSESSLEQRCQSLHEKATRDPLTQVANRAEFDRVHAQFVTAHQQQQVPCSLMMCDLDKFKHVNDTYGHQAGDAVIQCLAALLKSSCRPGDLVARYGGEEFVVLCADCDNTAATRRAEQIRAKLARIRQPKLGGRPVTVSFGVTEIQPGDTPETMLRRADRALLMAKSKGRNTVVQLGTGSGGDANDSASPLAPLGRVRPQMLLEQVLITPVPIKMAIEKLRGFVADHAAKIIKIDGSQVWLEMAAQRPTRVRRFTDRPVTFGIELIFEEDRIYRDSGDPACAGALRTRIRVTISPRKNRDRRRRDVADRAREVLVSFRSYLMAIDDEPSPAEAEGALKRAKRILTPWKAK